MDEQPPSQAAIEMLIANGLVDEATRLIKKWGIKMPGASMPSVGTEAWLAKFITRNPVMLEMKDMVRKLAPISDTVLICGDTGTGKELIARALHGDRMGKFVALNCAGMPEHLIESELFGHVAGAFTDARQTKAGLMKAANDGTLFLDEIGDLALPLQAKFLRALQERTIRKVGSNEEEPITCRIVCATHWQLCELIEQKKFRLDLYARISTFQIDTLSLEKRLEDIEPIVMSLDSTGDTWKMIKDMSWDFPLNVRTLEQIVKRWTVLKQKPMML